MSATRFQAAASTSPSAPRQRTVFECPFCHSKLIKRSSFLLHPYLRSDTYTCTNPLCNASFTGHNELTHLTSPTGIPDAAPCHLPEMPAELRQQALKEWRGQQSANEPGSKSD